MDGEEGAADTYQAPHMTSSSDLHMGAASHLTPGTFFSGLIDDVRIPFGFAQDRFYHRAVRP